MNRYQPEIMPNFGEPFAIMAEETYGEYVRIEEVAEWLRQQRNDVPVTGEEMANRFLHVLGEEI